MGYSGAGEVPEHGELVAYPLSGREARIRQS